MRPFLIALTISLSLTAAAAARETVGFDGYPTGTVVVKTSERHLYFVTAPGRALRYPVGVGRAGKSWSGRAIIDRRVVAPGWIPPDDVRRDHPKLPLLIPGGSPANPMGAAALTLNRGDYAIHGTNQPNSIGQFVSYGCIRMYNADVLELYRMTREGTPVVVLP
jgi:lipoprotein-anchoring transpeptidase ErfK/SrfK